MVKKVAIITLGCRVNQSESSVIEGSLRQYGASIVGPDDNPDYCIVNTCTVTARSDANSRQLIRRAARSGARVIVTGCYSELSPEEASGMGGVCAVVPVSDKDSIIGYITGRESEPFYNLHDRARPYLKVQDGCNFSCSYCAVPIARGRSRSIPVDEAVRRAALIVGGGYHEIVLTGIHLGSYGHDLTPRRNLAYLIRKILSETNINRIRLSSIEINEIDDELIELFSDSRLCRHLHLPLQSGSDRILAVMKRHYTSRAFRDKVDRIAGKFRDIAIGTDVIAGFPSESEEDFGLTLGVLEDLPFSYLHLFPYSDRKGTTASNMNLKISDRIISLRMDALKRLNRAKRDEYASSNKGKIVEVIAESGPGDRHTFGTSSNYLKIRVPYSSISKGTLIFVSVVNASPESLDGFVIT